MNLTKMRDENEIKETCCCIPVSKSDCLGFAFLACPRVASYLSRHSRLQPLLCLIMFILHFFWQLFLWMFFLHRTGSLTWAWLQGQSWANPRNRFPSLMSFLEMLVTKLMTKVIMRIAARMTIPIKKLFYEYHFENGNGEEEVDNWWFS